MDRPLPSVIHSLDLTLPKKGLHMTIHSLASLRDRHVSIRLHLIVRLHGNPAKPPVEVPTVPTSSKPPTGPSPVPRAGAVRRGLVGWLPSEVAGAWEPPEPGSPSPWWEASNDPLDGIPHVLSLGLVQSRCAQLSTRKNRAASLLHKRHHTTYTDMY